jgi:hypothetical protein
MVWTAVIVALAVSLVVFAAARCRRASKLVERILTEEIGPKRVVCRAEPVPRSRTPVASDELLGAEQR